MCVAIIGKVLEIKDKTAIVEYHGTKVKARRDLSDAVPSDYVLIHAGCIIQKVTEADKIAADDILSYIQ